ncbi:hypothetical protein FKZ61_008165 [Litorilinea aerophila]|nr:hypothetical protein [Litorilinea aerophila]MCC9076084.1 hypothetical protein [Litorilinea aerophila]
MGLAGEDGALRLPYCIHHQGLVKAQELDGHYPIATSATHLDAGGS